MPDYTAPTGTALDAKEVRELYEELRGTFAGRNDEYHQYRQRYDGIHWGTPELPTQNGKHAITLNYVRPTVDKAVSMLLGSQPGIQVLPPGADAAARRLAEYEEALLYATWDVNHAATVFRRVAHNAILLRRGFIFYWWDNVAKRVRFRSVSPENVYPVYDGEDMLQVLIVSERLTSSLKARYPDLASQIVPDTEGDETFGGNPEASHSGPTRMAGKHTGMTKVLDWYDRDGNWTRVMGEAVHSQNLDYGTGSVPLIEFVNRVTGDEREPASEITDIWDLNLELNRLVSQSADIISKYANPTVVDYGSGQDPQTVRRTLQGEGAVIPARQQSRIEFLNWTGQPPDIQNQFGRLMQAIHDLSGQPPSAYGQTLTNQSGVMTNLSMTPTVTANQDRQTQFGHALEQLNEAILRLYEQFMKGQDIDVRGSRPKRAGSKAMKFYEVVINGSDINGWYLNRIKWPSALRTDDPVYVQNIIGRATAQPILMSVYDALEALGEEDVEAHLDRVKQQLEDPRFNPQGLQSAIGAATALSEVPDMPTDMDGFDPGYDPGDGEGMGGGPDMNTAAVAQGNPNRDTLVGRG